MCSKDQLSTSERTGALLNLVIQTSAVTSKPWDECYPYPGLLPCTLTEATSAVEEKLTAINHKGEHFPVL